MGGILNFTVGRQIRYLSLKKYSTATTMQLIKADDKIFEMFFLLRMASKFKGDHITIWQNEAKKCSNN